MAGIRPPDNAAPAAQPESTEGQQCTLFVLCSQYVLFGKWGLFRPLVADFEFGGDTFRCDIRAFRVRGWKIPLPNSLPQVLAAARFPKMADVTIEFGGDGALLWVTLPASLLPQLQLIVRDLDA